MNLDDEHSRAAILAAAFKAFEEHMGTPAGSEDSAALVRWDEEGRTVWVIEDQGDGVLVASANPAGAWAVFLGPPALSIVADLAARKPRAP